MSRKNKNREKLLADFVRYHRNEMTGEERNSFEKELQKDPFAEETAEGYSLISPEEITRDLIDLQSRIKARTAKKQRFMVYRIAASVAVLMVISTIFIVIDRNKTSKQLTVNSVRSEKMPIIKEQPAEKQNLAEAPPEKPAGITDKKSDQTVSLQLKIEKAKSALPVDSKNIAGAQNNDSISEIRPKVFRQFRADKDIAQPAAALARAKNLSGSKISGKVLSSEDNLPVPGANVLIKGTSTGVITDAGGNFSITVPDSINRTQITNFVGMESKEFEAKRDSEVQVRLDPSISALSEVVVVGYGTKRAESEKEEVFTGYAPPIPVSGKSNFDKYIKENQHRPDTITTGQRAVVVISFLVRINGSIDSIRIVRSPGKIFSDEAIRLIKSGPSWKPAEDNGKPIEDEVSIRIVFR